MYPVKQCWCIIKPVDGGPPRRCLGKASEGTLTCFRDSHECQNEIHEVEETLLENQFLQAAYEGDWERMRDCLNVNEDVYTFVDSNNWSAVHYAVKGLQNDIVEKLFHQRLYQVELSELGIYTAGPRKNLYIVRKIIMSQDQDRTLIVDSAKAAAKSGNLKKIQWLMSSYPRQIHSVRDDLLMTIAKNNHLDLATFLVEEGDYVFNDDILLKLSSADVPNMEVLKMLLTKTNADLDSFVYYLPKITSKKYLMWLMSFNGGPTQKRLGKMFRNLVDTYDLELLKWFKRKYDLDLNNLYTFRYLETALDEKDPRNDGVVARWLVTEGQVDVNNTILGLTPVMYACVEAVEKGTLKREQLCLTKNLVEICDASLDDIDTRTSHKNVWTLLLPFRQKIDNSEEDDLVLEDCLETFLSKGLPPTVVYETLLQTRYVDMF
jgi:ankyrin repeat protein